MPTPSAPAVSRPFRSLLLGLVALASLGDPAAAQGQAPTYRVVDDDGGPGVDHTSLAEAVAAAAEGELLLVHAGRYGGFQVASKAVRIVAAGDGPVEIAGNVRIQFLAGWQQFLLRGLSSPPDGEAFTITLKQNLGRVWVEECTVGAFGSDTTFAALSANGDTSVALVRSRFRGGAQLSQLGGGGGHGRPAADLSLSNVWAYACTFEGGDGATPGADGGPGVRQFNYELFLAECDLTGGDGATGGDCTSGGDGGNGIERLGFVSNLHTRATRAFAGSGAPGGCPTASSGLDGLPSLTLPGANTLNPLGAARRGFVAEPLIGAGEPFVLSYEAPAGETVFTLASVSMGVTQHLAAGGIALILPDGPTVQRGPLPPGGQIALPGSGHFLPPGWETVTVYFQSLFVPDDGSPAILGPPSSTAVLAGR